MKLNDAKNIMFGDRQVKKVYLGNHLIWPTEQIIPPEPSIPNIPDEYKLVKAIEYKYGIKQYQEKKKPPSIEIILYGTPDKRKIECDYIPYKSYSSYNYDPSDVSKVKEGYIFNMDIVKFNYRGTFGSSSASLMYYTMPDNYNPNVEGGDYYGMNIGGSFFQNAIKGAEEIRTNAVIEEDKLTINGSVIEYKYKKDFNTETGSLVISSNIMSIRIYSIKVYDDNNLTCEFLPVILKTTGEIGLYDTVNGNFTKQYISTNNGDSFYTIEGESNYD